MVKLVARLIGMGLVVWLGVTGVVAEAQDLDEEPTGFSAHIDLEEYQPVPAQSRAERVSAPVMVTLAYGLMWLLAFVFVLMAWRKGTALQEDLRAAMERLSRLERKVEEDHGETCDGIDG